MKIHNLSIKNMASLDGEHEINFDKIMQDSHLFAITGQTGAGKSTILNCISLALYGKVYKKNSTGFDFITLGKPEGEVSLIFSSSGKKYKANWKQRIAKKNGEPLKNPELKRQIFVLESSSEKAIDTPIEEITNLTYTQFCKTTILNQGQFSKFLTSNFTQRKEILEKFYQGDDLNLISNVLKEKIKRQVQLKDEKSNLIEGLTQSFNKKVLTKQELTSLENELQHYSKDEKQIVQLKKYLKETIEALQLIKKNQEKKNYLKEQITNINRKLNEALDQLNIYTKKSFQIKDNFANKKPLLLESLTKLEEKKQYQAQSQELTAERQESINQLKNVTSKITQIQSQKNEIQHQQEKLKAKSKTLQSPKLKSFDKYYDMMMNYYSDRDLAQNNLNHTLQQLKSRENKLSELSSHIETIQKKFEILSNKDLTNKAQDLEQKIKLLEQTTYQYSQLNMEEEKNKSLLDELKVNLTQIDKELNLTQEELNTLKINKTKKTKELEKFKLDAAIHLCQKTSQEQGYCVVCHSDKQLSTSHFSPHESEDHNLTNELKLLEEREASLQKQYLQWEVKKTTTKDQFSKAQQNQQKMIKAKNSLIEKLKEQIAHKISLSDSDLKKTLLVLEEERDIILDQTQQKNILTEQLRSKKQDQTELSEEVTSLRKNKVVLQQKLDNLQQNKDHQIKDYQAFSYIQTVQDLKDNKEMIQHFLDLDSNSMLLNIELKSLNQNKEELESLQQKIDFKKQNIEDKIKQLTVFLQNNTSTGDPKREMEQWENEIKEIDSKVVNIKDQIKIYEIEYAQLKSKLESTLEQLEQTELLKKSYIYELFEVTKTPPLCLQTNPQQFSSLEKIFSKLINMDENKTDLNILELTFQEISQQVEIFNKLIREKEKNYLEQLGYYKQKKQTEEKIKIFNSELTLINEKLAKLDELYQVIGKDEFRNYVLSTIENLLLEQTNTELKILCQGRYGLSQTNKAHKMASEFVIVDYFHDAKMRKISTLSGGETFLVSLAMAMALAELTRGSTQIDSLFIDEGFGTLDEEAIDEVYQLLQVIQNTGKQIGIISHVKDLTTRIPINIHLAKSTEGHSKISVVQN